MGMVLSSRHLRCSLGVEPELSRAEIEAVVSEAVRVFLLAYGREAQ